MIYLAQSLISINDRSVELRWNRNLESDLAGYIVYMSIADEKHFERVTPVPLPEPVFVSPLLRPDTRYYFQVSAIDSSGNESPRSPVVEYSLPDYSI
ncbi:fibronectin type III domain-containing protein (plasmid) [Paenibacillus sp. EC2-1]|uniref:fibronectin type III domain-containing protein n=1 Tax=Paenibacillus sp. EC2-1 TaxID=3388665 RepID=UPI003BEF2A06